jgi:hypothetical protein
MANFTVPVPGATPPFLPQPSGNAQGMPIPGVSAPTEQSIQAQGQLDIGKLLQLVSAAAQPKTQLAAPILPPIGKEVSTQPPAYMATRPGWGPERFMATLSGTIHNAVIEHKQQQQAKALSDWQALDLAFERSGGNPQKMMQDPIAQAILGDPKKMKHLAKALNQDWLNPEKTTVYGEAMKQLLSQKMKRKQAEHMAFQELGTKLRQQFMQEMMARMPTAPVQDQKAVQNVLSVAKLGELAKENRARIMETAQYHRDMVRQHADDLEARIQQQQAMIAEREKEHQDATDLKRQLFTWQQEYQKQMLGLRRLQIQEMAALRAQAAAQAKSRGIFSEFQSAEKTLAPLNMIIDTSRRVQGDISTPTGPGDVELMFAFVTATKPAAGFRFTNTEMNLIQTARGWAQGAQARIQGGYSGILFSPSQRRFMADIVDKSAKQARENRSKMYGAYRKLNPDLADTLEMAQPNTEDSTDTAAPKIDFKPNQ